MTRYDEDAMRRPHGGRHPLAGLPQELLDAALRGIRQAADLIEPGEGQDHEAAYLEVIEPILIELRAAGFLGSPLFVASPANYEVQEDGSGEPVTGQVLDLHDWPHSEDVTELLFGARSIPWDKAVWAAKQLNTDYAIGPAAWRNHQEKIKEGAK
ncbi:hypothetical protein [Actinophytocola sp.]|uniref:hypothetical protein n=1 Tax=Actinophytocola sp. TaxID=1872138 RepID=UPI002D7F4EC2|nr:hypothetical protein [Actinophytocola sp.]HET9144059.1 hypothetical protein [Actinophytocola sp.]